MSAADRWRAQLEAWALPEELLAQAEESPYGWPVELWRRRNRAEREHAGEAVTTRVVRSHLPPGGRLIDIGAGTGRASLPLAAEGYRLVAVERNPGMAEGLRTEAEAAGVEVEVIEEPWPAAAERAGTADVVMCAHVVYDVQDIAPFLSAMAGAARVAAVIELTRSHPWSSLAPYYRRLHRLDRPDGPTVGDLAEVVEEVVGVSPEVEEWERPGDLWFENWDEILEFYGRRLVLPASRRDELRELLAPELRREGDRMYVGERERRLATVWWRARGGSSRPRAG